ncbi:MAG: AAA family ATPase [Lachnospiraceae bacterium]
MGVYLNPESDMFQEAVNAEIYVDKTDLISHTNRKIKTPQKFICISRPRRFGKSMTAFMLAAYYEKTCDYSELFSAYKISKDKSFRKYLNQFNVIMLNIQNLLTIKNNNVDSMLSYLQSEVISELGDVFSGQVVESEKNLSVVLDKLYSKTRESFIFIIDEWDCILRDKRYNQEDVKEYLDFIRNLFKDKSYVALAYMTGILPVKKYGTHSALNMFSEYSMTNADEFAPFVGFTEDEVKILCEKHDIDFDEMKNWYDGYVFPNENHIYNPKSVVDSILRRRFSSYWTQTETYEALKMYIDMNFDGLKDAVTYMLAGEKAKINTDRFQNDMTTFCSKDDVLTLLIHLGYLAYDCEEGLAFIPNVEIRGEFRNAIEGAGWNDILLVGINYDKTTKKHTCIIKPETRTK